MTFSILVAVSENNVIGKDNQLQWHLPKDMRWFKNLTLGKMIIMGRKTFEALGKPLPKRRSVVISRNVSFKPKGVEIVDSVEKAFSLAKQSGETEVFIIGGGEIYRQSLPFVDRIYLTRIYGTFKGDTFFTIPNPEEWQETFREKHLTDEKHAYAFDFIIYNRKPKNP